MKRLYKNNQLAVLTNPRWGWWLKHHDWDLVLDSVLIEMVLNNQHDQIQALVPDSCKNLIKDLEVEWLTRGTKFRIESYRGTEMVTVLIRGNLPITGSQLDLDKDWLEA